MYIVRVSFVRFCKSLMSFFKISIITATASSIGTDGYKFTTSKEVCISLGDIFLSFAFPQMWMNLKLCVCFYLR